MDNVAEGIYALDCDGLVTYANRAACDMLGWTEDELMGQSMHELVHFRRAPTARPSPSTIATWCTCAPRVVPLRSTTMRTPGGTARSFPWRTPQRRSGVVPLCTESSSSSGTPPRRKRSATPPDSELATLSWVGRIRDAIDEDRLELYSQPIVPIGPGGSSEELLLRMRGRDGEVIQPGTFLPVAERFGLITEIDRWVITEAAKLAAQEDRTVELNLSAVSIGTSDLLPFIEHQLR